MDVSFVPDDGTAGIEFLECRILYYYLTPYWIEFDEAVEVIRRLVKYNILEEIRL